LAGGISTSGAVTSWLRDIVGGASYSDLIAEADASGPGGRGLLMLPYFSGERTDPDARGVLAGLRIDHTRGDIYRAALEATAFGVRRDIHTMRAAGAKIDRIVAVGGGTRGGLWTRIVSDVTGLPQEIPSITIGASYGAAWLAARLNGAAAIADWNPPAKIIEPETRLRAHYDVAAELFGELYESTSSAIHQLATQADNYKE
jgi:xylulokinase